MNPSMHIRTVAAPLLLGGLSTAQLARAEYQETPVRIVVNAAPGGAADSTTPEVAAELPQRLGHHFIVDNNPGAARAIGLNEVAKVFTHANLVGVRPSLPVKTLNELVAYAPTPYQGWIALPHIFI